MRNLAEMTWMGENELFDLCNTVAVGAVGGGKENADIFEDPALTAKWRRLATSRDLAVLTTDDLTELRDLVRAALDAADRGAPLPGPLRGRLSYLAAGAPVTYSLDQRGDLVMVEMSPNPYGRLARNVLQLYARSKHELVVRRCQAAGCGKFFEPRRADQEWCSTRCGTRVRAARFRAARRSGE